MIGQSLRDEKERRIVGRTRTENVTQSTYPSRTTGRRLHPWSSSPRHRQEVLRGVGRPRTSGGGKVTGERRRTPRWDKDDGLKRPVFRL